MKRTLKLTLTAVLSALCYVAFYHIRIDIPTGVGYTSVHMGNAACCLASLLIGGNLGGLVGAIGMGVGDILSPQYILTAPKTIILKYVMGFICGYFAHDIFKIKQKQGKQLYLFTTLSVAIAMICNVILEPLFGSLYYGIILGNAEKAKTYLTLVKFLSTGINAIVSILVVSPIYVLLKPTISRFDNKK